MYYSHLPLAFFTQLDALKFLHSNSEITSCDFFFFFLTSVLLLYECIIIYPFTCDGHLSYFQFGAHMNKAVANTFKLAVKRKSEIEIKVFEVTCG